MEENSVEEQRETYRRFINQMVAEINDIQDLKRIYTLVYVKHEKVT